MTSVALAVTGIAVSGGVLGGAPAKVTTTANDLGAQRGDESASAGTGAGVGAAAIDRAVTSRSADRRTDADPAKVSALSATSGPARTSSVDLSQGDPKDIARTLMGKFGFGADQFGCLDSLWTRESGWNPAAHNASSGAHGIPQALPGSKMASAGPDWEHNAATQITWGLGYIQDRYGSPCGAWGHSESHGWY
ncbi:lytic transglycosylase domain-containing protein [Nocardioides sp. URHA0020]|uniref:aggregation-promoting factor C-terminal-like domain-containing protein n=1 Tax=Nocardioides sp. URHA0020 TaxID=1380392 RepID=UPI001E42F15B|nr:lytic transglycosylase domain-containing protein [Nocardioides sp. URHA0020]